ncbi:hypothetical protein [Ammonifex thiophilus]|uniref:Uncharacterized protein n=1 Tax=Ammonifex thiophilus TaxID=444093 RepID=A0A3D8P326_9THEO|nr:hypothetical protein [Ammonifex thiophilus]RDV81189.1 hypothetical protein DXX99_09870 [Ammonifex thiophilus]
MGAKGRDLLLWLFFLLAPLAPFFKALVLPLALLALGYFSFFPYLARAGKKSRELGLKWVVLLPLHPWWARLLLFLSGKKLRWEWEKAFEVHVEAPPGVLPWEFLKGLSSDLELAARKFPGCLFLWESHVPIPAFVRRLIRGGWGFWEEGRWFVPRFPLTARETKGRKVKRGAVVVPQDFGKGVKR